MHVLKEEVGVLGCKGRVAWVPVERQGMVLLAAGIRANMWRPCVPNHRPPVHSPLNRPNPWPNWASLRLLLSHPLEAENGLERYLQNDIAGLQVPAGNHATQAGGAGLAQGEPTLRAGTADVRWQLFQTAPPAPGA